MITRVIIAALFGGAAAGLIAGVLQLLFVQPVLLHAELFETGAMTHFGTAPTAAHMAHPGIDPLRDGLSVIFSMLTYTGYGLLLVAAMSLGEDRGAGVDGRHGIVWGLAGFVAFHLAPGVSLAPEVPGVAAADLTLRQIWWFATVAAAAVAMALIAFGRRPLVWGVAVLLLLAPHLIGAPEPDTFAGTVPPELSALFAARALGVGMAAWALLGCLCGYFWQREGVRLAQTA